MSSIGCDEYFQTCLPSLHYLQIILKFVFYNYKEYNNGEGCHPRGPIERISKFIPLTRSGATENGPNLLNVRTIGPERRAVAGEPKSGTKRTFFN